VQVGLEAQGSAGRAAPVGVHVHRGRGGNEGTPVGKQYAGGGGHPPAGAGVGTRALGDREPVGLGVQDVNDAESRLRRRKIGRAFRPCRMGR